MFNHGFARSHLRRTVHAALANNVARKLRKQVLMRRPMSAVAARVTRCAPRAAGGGGKHHMAAGGSRHHAAASRGQERHAAGGGSVT
eukprot:2333568-Prymnesium_polylepis.1